jgi:hypothetical protein
MWRRASEIPADERRYARRVTIAATVLFTLVLTGGRPWRLFERGGFTGNFYDVQAQSFLRGRLAVPAEVAGIEGFLIDGKTYLYYGPFLAIVRLPAAVFGSWTEGRLSRLSMVVGFVLLCTVTFHLARRVARLVASGPGAPWRPALLVAAVACSPVLALAGSASVYHETELWAFTLMLATFVALLDLLHHPTTTTALVAAAAAAATVLTRVSIGLGATAAVVIVAALLWRRAPRPALTAVGVAAAGVMVHIALNLARFGTLLDLPADRQILTFDNPERAAWFAGNDNSFFGLHFIPTTVVHYLRPDAIAFERLVPFARFGPRAREFGSYPLESNTPASSLTASATLLVVLGVLGLVLAIHRREWRIAPLVVGAAVAALPTLAIGFVANRYLVDLLPGFVALGAVATAAFHTDSRRLALGAVWVLALFGAGVNTALALWLDGIQRPSFTERRYEIDEQLFGGTPPSVIDLRPDEPVPRDGVVAIDGQCDGLYIAAEQWWVPLELADGARRVRGTLDPSHDGVALADGEEPRISVSPTADGRHLVVTFDPGSGPPVRGEPIDWDGDPVPIEIWSDPTGSGLNRGLRVWIDGDLALTDFSSPDLSTLEPGSGFVVTEPADGGVPICNALARRR